VWKKEYCCMCTSVEWRANVADFDYLNLCVVELLVAYQCCRNSFRESSLTAISLYVFLEIGGSF
jgi:hypothetical protein